MTDPAAVNVPSWVSTAEHDHEVERLLDLPLWELLREGIAAHEHVVALVELGLRTEGAGVTPRETEMSVYLYRLHQQVSQVRAQYQAPSGSGATG